MNATLIVSTGAGSPEAPEAQVPPRHTSPSVQTAPLLWQGVPSGLWFAPHLPLPSQVSGSVHSVVEGSPQAVPAGAGLFTQIPQSHGARGQGFGGVPVVRGWDHLPPPRAPRALPRL